ncbi:MAG TPA: VirB8/TrbF family protein [Polyangiales bacterium]|nr:VirB8/TrbF family protein [Polyangiales bacterium]
MAERVPYLVGAREYSDYFGTRALEVQRYRRSLAWSVGLNVVLGVALVAVTLLCRAVPYVVQTDRTGYQVAIGPAERVGPSDERVRIAASAKWIRALRTVVTDEAAQVEFKREVHAMLASGTAAKQKAVEWLDKQAGSRNSARTVSVEITRVAPREGGKLIEVEWLEHERVGTTTRSESQYAAIVTLARSSLQRLDEIVANPLGLFVIDFSVSKLR